jgi:hypothetical protein
VNDGANGVSDIFIIPAALNWTFGDLQINPQIFIVAPTGDYQKGQLANIGIFIIVGVTLTKAVLIPTKATCQEAGN